MRFKAPFPYFGGKSKIAPVVWERFGNPRNYVEPFFGSGAILLSRPGWNYDVNWIETVNDASGFVANFWRALQHDPEGVAFYADNPVNENDLHARHSWLVQNHLDTLPDRLNGDPEFYDTKIAGWWVWGICSWIGSGWCSGKGPWRSVDGVLVNTRDGNDPGVNKARVHLSSRQGVNKSRVHPRDAGIDKTRVNLGNAGKGINRQSVHLGDAGKGINRQNVHLGDAGQGVHRQLVHLGNAGRGVNRPFGDAGNAGTGEAGLLAWMQALAARLRRVRVTCGDWSRVTGHSVTRAHGMTAIFLDPPYSASANRSSDLYEKDSESVGYAVSQWAIENGNNPKFRIALCGYRGEYDMPSDWERFAWSTNGGYENQSDGDNVNQHREMVWFSPHCIKPDESSKQLSLL